MAKNASDSRPLSQDASQDYLKLTQLCQHALKTEASVEDLEAAVGEIVENTTTSDPFGPLRTGK